MRLLLAGAMMCATISVAGAQAASSPKALGGAPEPVNVGSTIICDTSEQAQRFLVLRNTGTETSQALQLVNTEAKVQSACGAAVVAFQAGEEMGIARVDGKRVKIVKVTVLAYNNGSGWTPVPATVQYAIMALPGIEA